MSKVGEKIAEHSNCVAPLSYQKITLAYQSRCTGDAVICDCDDGPLW